MFLIALGLASAIFVLAELLRPRPDWHRPPPTGTRTGLLTYTKPTPQYLDDVAGSENPYRFQ